MKVCPAQPSTIALTSSPVAQFAERAMEAATNRLVDGVDRRPVHHDHGDAVIDGGAHTRSLQYPRTRQSTDMPALDSRIVVDIMEIAQSVSQHPVQVRAQPIDQPRFMQVESSRARRNVACPFGRKLERVRAAVRGRLQTACQARASQDDRAPAPAWRAECRASAPSADCESPELAVDDQEDRVLRRADVQDLQRSMKSWKTQTCARRMK